MDEDDYESALAGITKGIVEFMSTLQREGIDAASLGNAHMHMLEIYQLYLELILELKTEVAELRHDVQMLKNRLLH